MFSFFLLITCARDIIANIVMLCSTKLDKKAEDLNADHAEHYKEDLLASEGTLVSSVNEHRHLAENRGDTSTSRKRETDNDQDARHELTEGAAG